MIIKNVLRVYLISGIALIALTFTFDVHSADKPTCIAKRTTGRIFVDGFMAEDDWKEAEPLPDFVFPWHKEGKKGQTEVRLLWDDEYLYVFFRCSDEHISAHFYQRNSKPYSDDCVEVFAAPNLKNPLWYMNFEINCLGTWLLGLHKGEENKRLEPDGILVGRSHVGTINKEDDKDEWWSLEIGLPFAMYKPFEGNIPPKPGDEWGINFNRCGGDVNQQHSQWTASATEGPNFHRPQDFGMILFSESKVR